jgi:hypothetical protein
MLLQTIGQRLSHKPFEWMSWWWGLRWEAFISIHPQLTEETPLWNRDENSLKSVRLFKLPPNELQAEIARYWEKPFWRRWLLRLFTPIKSKIVVWSYYKQCLSFREVCKHYPVVEQQLMVYEPEQRIVSLLVNELKRDNLTLENRLEKHIGNPKWMGKNLSLILAKHEERRYRVFLKLLDKYLKDSPEEYDQESVRKKLEQEYQELGKMLRNYLQMWCQPSINQLELPQSAEENLNRALVYVGPAEVAERTITSIADTDLSCSIAYVNNWVSSIRRKIEEMLKEESLSYEEIQALLKASLVNLRLLIQPQLNNYQDLVNEARINGVHPNDGIKWLKFLEVRLNSLTSFFRSSVLLFHPDKSYGDENLRIIKTELFKEFQQFTENSLGKLNQGLRTLKRCIPRWRLDFDNMLEKIEEDRVKFKEQFDKKCTEIAEKQAEMETKQAEIKEEQDKIKIALNNILRQLDFSRTARNSVSGEQEQPLEYTRSSPRP